MGGDHGGPMLIESPAEREKRERAEEDSREAARERLHREKTLAFDRTIAITSMLAAGFLIWQNIETHRSVTATQEAVQIARDTLRASEQEGKESAARADVQLALSKESLAQTRAAMETSTDLAKSAIGANISASRRDQRAWVGVQGLGSPPTFAVGSSPTFSVTLINLGRSPASGMEIRDMMAYVPAGKPYDFDTANHDAWKRAGIMHPGAPHDLTMSWDESLSSEISEAVLTQSARFYVFGDVQYRDVFSVRHRTRFCYWLVVDNRRPRAFTACETHNEAD